MPVKSRRSNEHCCLSRIKSGGHFTRVSQPTIAFSLRRCGYKIHDNGRGKSSGRWKTLEVRIAQYYFLFDGLQEIDE